MIVGNGLIASAFAEKDLAEVIFFASGVSNSSETDPAQFLREKNLVQQTLKTHPEKTFVYFSTCSIYDSSKHDSPYVLHKLHMEEIIRQTARKFLIVRVSNAVGFGGNPNLLMNYLASAIRNNLPLTIHQKATRNLIDVEDVSTLTMNLLEKQSELNKIYNLAYKTNFGIHEIVTVLERHFGMPAQKNYVSEGESYSIDIRGIESYFKETEKMEYLSMLIAKYYLVKENS